MKPLVCFALATLLLGGCASEPTAPASSPAPAASVDVTDIPAKPAGAHHGCDSSAVAGLRGKPADAAVLEQARKRAGALQARLIGPDDMVTLDYNSQRLNLGVDARGVVQTISCG